MRDWAAGTIARQWDQIKQAKGSAVLAQRLPALRFAFLRAKGIIFTVAVMAGVALVSGCGSGSRTTAVTSLPSRPSPLNFLPNPGFERGMTYWTPYGGSRDVVSQKARRTGRFGLLMSTEVAQPYGVQTLGVVGYPGKGESFLFSAWVKGSRTTLGRPGTLQINGRTRGGKATALATTTKIVSRRWTKIQTVVHLTRGDLVALDAFVLFQQAIAVGDAAYVDDLSLTLLR